MEEANLEGGEVGGVDVVGGGGEEEAALLDVEGGEEDELFSLWGV